MIAYQSAVRMTLCELCGLSFATRSTFKRHLKTVHTKSDCICCEVCGKLKRSNKFREHLLTHTTDSESSAHNREVQPETTPEQFLCEICGLTFPLKVLLRQHTRTHATPSEEFLCEICGMTFRKIKLFNRHQRSHATSGILFLANPRNISL